MINTGIFLVVAVCIIAGYFMYNTPQRRQQRAAKRHARRLRA